FSTGDFVARGALTPNPLPSGEGAIRAGVRFHPPGENLIEHRAAALVATILTAMQLSGGAP
ncbi:hypothetical protein SB11R_20465, partial [Pseudomonas oryzihabitans]